MKYFNFLLIASLLSSLIVSQELESLTPTDLLSMMTISGFTLSPDGQYLIISIKKWISETGNSYTHLMYKNLETNETKILTPNIEGQSDLSPQFSSSFPNILFFQRTSKDIKSSIYYMKFPPEEEIKDEDRAIRLTNYPLPVNNYKIKAKTIIFSTEVYFKCQTMVCSASFIEEEKNQDYQVYNQHNMFFWDRWLVEGKGSHLFVQNLDLDENSEYLILDKEVKDITYNMEVNTPPLNTDFSYYDLSSDGTKVAFTAHLRNDKEAFDTGYKTYYYNLNLMKNPVCITNHTKARTQNPVFSKDGTKIAYIANRSPGLGFEIMHLEIYNIMTGITTILPNKEELYINSILWDTDSRIIFCANTFQVNKLFTINTKNIIDPLISSYDVKYETMSYTLPIFALKNKNVAVVKISAYDSPERLSLLKYNNLNYQIDILDLNEELIKTKFISKAEQFSFEGGHKDEVFGFFFRPINFDPDKTYPVVVLIHGGPESSWSQEWGLRWNPQIYASRGYAVIMVNPHGSVGFGEKFQNEVRGNWGGVPFEDIILGVTYILNSHSFLDRTRMCAAGASYGGYMINWIEGHNYINETLGRDWTFKCLANHAGIFNLNSMFSSTEILWFTKTEYCDKNNRDCNPWDEKEIRKLFEMYSPETYVKNWNTPMIVSHGGIDKRVPYTEGLSTFTALQLRDIPSKFIFLPGENHWILKPENQIKWYNELITFIDNYINN